MRRPARTSAIAVLAAFAALALWAWGCGSGQDPVALLRGAIDRTSQLRSARIDLEVEGLQGQGNSLFSSLSLEGVLEVDFPANAFALSTDLIGFPLELRLVDGALYLNFSGAWYSHAESLLAGFGLGAIQEALPAFTDIFELMRNFSKVEKLGAEKVDGTDCDHLSVSPDYGKLVDSEKLNALLGPLLGDPGRARVTLEDSHLSMEVWVARDSGLIKQAAFSFDIDVPEIPGLSLFLPSGPTGFQAALTLSGYNEPLRVDAPAGARPLTPGSGILPRSTP